MSEAAMCERDVKAEGIPLPKKHRAKIIIWNDLSVDHVDMLMEAQRPDDIKHILADIFDITGYQKNRKEEILISLYLYTVQYAKDNGFTPEQLSTVFSIVKQVHETCTETPFGNLNETFQYFKDLLICHSVNRPPYSTELFSIDEIRLISHYVINTYFRHFKMYKYVFTPLVRLGLVINYLGEAETPESPNLEAVTEEDERRENGEPIVSPSEEGQQTPQSPQTQDKEESEARKHLRNLITEFLEEEINSLKVSVQEKLKETEESLTHKLEEAGYQEANARKTATNKQSAKNKRK